MNIFEKLAPREVSSTDLLIGSERQGESIDHSMLVVQADIALKNYFDWLNNQQDKTEDS